MPLQCFAYEVFPTRPSYWTLWSSWQTTMLQNRRCLLAMVLMVDDQARPMLSLPRWSRLRRF